MKAWPWFLGSIVLAGIALFFGLAFRGGPSANTSLPQPDPRTLELATQLEEQKKATEAAEHQLADEREQAKAAELQRQADDLAKSQAEQLEKAAAEKAEIEKQRQELESQKRELQARAAKEQADRIAVAQQARADQERARQQEERDIQERLRKRQEELDNAPKKYTFPAGISLHVSLSQEINSDRMKAGASFEATLTDPLQASGVQVIPRGTRVIGQVQNVQRAGRVSGNSELTLVLTQIRIGSQAQAISTSSYEAQGKGQTGSTVKTAIGGAAIGALIGGLSGGGEGAAQGAAVGGAAGTGAALLIRGPKLRIPVETVLEFTLDQPFTITK